MDVLGAVSPGAAAIAEPNPANPHIGVSLIPGVALGVGGFMFGKKHGHPVLGFLGFEAVGLNAYRAYRNHPGDRIVAATNLATSAAAIIGSLAWKKHPFFGWCVGLAAGIVATSFVAGSNASKLRSSG